MDLSNFKLWARRQLGGGDCMVNVELDDVQLEQALNNAKEWFNAYVGLYRESTFSMVSGQSEYDLSSVSPKIEEIENIWFPNESYQIDYSVLYPGFLDVDGFPYVDGFLFGVGYPQTTLVQQMQTMESMNRILGMETNWEYVSDRMVEPNIQMLRIMPQPTRSGTCLYVYRVDPEDIELKHYKPRDLLMVREYALAQAKYMLGRRRGKYTNGLPSAGGDRTLDGEILLQEYRDDIERLERRILDYQGPIAPVLG